MCFTPQTIPWQGVSRIFDIHFEEEVTFRLRVAFDFICGHGRLPLSTLGDTAESLPTKPITDLGTCGL